MNKRLLNSVLIVIMLAIWIVVLYRVFNFFKTDDSIVAVRDNLVLAQRSLNSFAKDTFDLKKVNRDPFLDKVNKVRKKKVIPVSEKSNQKLPSKNNKTTIKKKVNESNKWPKLSYYGYIKGAKSSSVLILIKVDNQLHKIREGDKLDNIAVKKVYRDSIIVEMNKQTKSILKN